MTIPYWDGTVDQDPSAAGTPFTDDFMGGDGDPNNGDQVATGSFAFASGNWTMNVNADGFNNLRRQFGVNAPTLPTPAQLTVALGNK